MPRKSMSRRDWFRLADSATKSGGQSNPPSDSRSPQPGLRPIGLPPNHDGMDLRELPPMREAQLSRDDVIALFDDIAALADEVVLLQRMTGAKRAGAGQSDAGDRLPLAREALLSGKVARLQIRYRWKQDFWIDTLKADGAGFHLVRIAHQNG